MKKNVLLVGENPFVMTGNSNMMQAIAGSIDLRKYEISCFSAGPTPDEFLDPFKPLPLRIIEASENGRYVRGRWKLVNLIKNTPQIDLVLFVGLDIWIYSSIYDHIKELQKAGHKVKTAAIFPYDSPFIQEGWVSAINKIDFPFVYSMWGYDFIKDRCPDLGYFRPLMLNHEQFFPLKKEERLRYRRETFKTCKDDTLIVGFIGNNQFRKTPQIHIEAFSLFYKKHPNSHFYMHTDLGQGVFDLKQTMQDFGLKKGAVSSKIEGFKYHPEHMNLLYNCFDVLLMCSSQEGLSWTPIEAGLAGVPCILSDSTAHKDLFTYQSVLCDTPYYIPVGNGNDKENFVKALCCNPEDIAFVLDFFKKDIESSREGVRENALKWVAGCSDINTMFDSVLLEKKKVKAVPKKSDILFVQHSAAGDVLMTTQCFKGIKEKHPGKKLIYMTQKKFQDVVRGNPYIDVIFDWDVKLLKEYEIVYNPHGERILPGGFNNLDDTLYSMYPYFCNVPADKMHIEESKPSIAEELESQPYIVIQTSGGDKNYRTYNHFDLVLKLSNLGMNVVQIGSVEDKAVHCENLTDLRGELTFNESAWVMRRAKAALLIDSFPAHLAGALGTPSVVLFGPAPARVTRPRDDEGVIVCLEPNKKDVCPSLTSCWGEQGRAVCQTPCINTISPFDVVKALKGVLS